MHCKALLAVIAVGGGLSLIAGTVQADSITPASFSTTLAVGGTTTITKTVTIDDAPPTSAPVDVLFFADTTGSMGGALSAVRTSISNIITNTSGLGDVRYGVAQYRDIFDSAPVNPYELRQDITSDTAAVIAAANTFLVPSGGGDTPEGQLPALVEAANTTSWRAGSTRILVWFGDALGHDPRGSFPGCTGAGSSCSEADAIDALVDNNVEVQSIGITSGANNFNSTGQATRITAATGGAHRDGIDSAAIVDEITDAITTALATYSLVDLDLSEVPPGVMVENLTGPVAGSFDRSVTRTFDFDLRFTGLSPGDYSFNIYALLDRGRVATEADRIVVTGDASIPPASVSEPATIVILAAGLLGVGALRRRNGRRKATTAGRA